MTREKAYIGGQKLQTYEKVSTVRALPHRAFDLPKVLKFASDRLAEFNASPTSGRECFGEWDVFKSKVEKNCTAHMGSPCQGKRGKPWQAQNLQK